MLERNILTQLHEEHRRASSAADMRTAATGLDQRKPPYQFTTKQVRRCVT